MLINYAIDKVGSEIKKRKDRSRLTEKEKKKQDEKEKGEVIVLNSANFDKLVMSQKDMWMVEFYTPWCTHCKQFEPEWNEAALKLKGQVKLGKVDANAEVLLS